MVRCPTHPGLAIVQAAFDVLDAVSQLGVDLVNRLEAGLFLVGEVAVVGFGRLDDLFGFGFEFAPLLAMYCCFIRRKKHDVASLQPRDRTFD